jgi:hypothetical protein
MRMFFTRTEAGEVLARLGVERSPRQVRTLEQNGIVRPAYVPTEPGDSTLHGAEELALLYLDALMEREGLPYVRRALTLQRVEQDVRAAVRRAQTAIGKLVVVDRLGGRVVLAGEALVTPVVFQVSLEVVAQRSQRAAREYRVRGDVWFGRRWTAPEDVAAQLAAV